MSCDMCLIRLVSFCFALFCAAYVCVPECVFVWYEFGTSLQLYDAIFLLTMNSERHVITVSHTYDQNAVS